MGTLGIDIGGTSVKVCLLDGEQEYTGRSIVYTNPTREMLTQTIDEAIGQLPDAISREMPVGLCLPGKRSARGDSIAISVNLPCLDGWAFDELLSSVLGTVPATYRVLSDVQAAGEDLLCAHKYCGRSAIIAIGTGVGVAVFDDGEPVGIGQRVIGHLGMMDIGRIGGCDVIGPDGSKNTLESYIGARAIEARFPGVESAELSQAIGTLAMDEPCMTAIVRMIRVVHAIYVPDQIVLMGGVGIALSGRGNEIKTVVTDGLTSLAKSDWELVFGDSPYHAARGAARSVS
jgi:glucokinase